MARWWTRWTRSQDEVEATELTSQIESHGAQAIGACERGQSVSIHGVVRSVTLRPRASAPSLEAEVYDGSGHITLVWIGHRRLSGVDVGRPITARGRVTCPQGSPTIFNPVYELYPEPVEIA
ncbi:MAG: OB-fold nucleic acid binding domain-containing protein [Candidatus Nanopelagicales bacterium]|jgi:RecG-like helicase